MARRNRAAVGDAAREGRDFFDVNAPSPAESVPLLVMPPEKVETSVTLTGLAAEIVLLLTMLPEKTETLSTEMPEAE